MLSSKKLSSINRKMAVVSAFVVTLLGLFFFISKSLNIISINQSFLSSAVSYSGSIFLILSGACFLCMIYIKQSAFYRLIAAALTLFSAIQFLGFFFSISGVLPHHTSDLEFYPLILMINFLLIGFIFLFWPKKINVKYIFFITVFCYLILFFNLTSVVLFVSLSNSVYSVVFLSNHFMTAVGQLIFSIGVICWGFFLLNFYKIKMIRWTPLVVVLLTGSINFGFFYWIVPTIRIKIVNDGDHQISQEPVVFLYIIFLAISLFLTLSIYIFDLYRDKVELREKMKDQLAIYRGISQTLFGTDTVKEASQKMLQILNQISNWQILVYWSWNEKKQALFLNSYVTIPGIAFPHFEKMTQELVVIEKSLFQLMFKNKQPLWFEDFSKEGFSRSFGANQDLIKGMIGLPVFGRRFSRVLAAQKELIKGAFITPVFEKEHLIGLVELFRTEPLESQPNEEWVEFMRNIGNEFSLFLERREAQIKEEKLKLIFNNSIDAIYSFDENLIITEWNSSAEALYGWTQKEAVGMSVETLYPKEFSSEFNLLKEQFDQEIGYQHLESKRVCKNGKIIPVDVIFSPFLAQVGEKTVISKDITELKKIDQSKNEFISMVSHELRTPLTTVIGALGLMNANNSVPQECKELLLLAIRNAERLTRIINDILDVERLQLGKLQLSLKQVSINKVVHEAFALSEKSAKDNQITLSEEIKVSPDIAVLADSDRLVQVLLNLLSNAIKFSFPQGKVVLSVEVEGEKVRVSVQDFGRGIPLHLQSKVFEKFFQAEGGDTRLKGTGLGLNISKNLIEQMKGKMGFVSQPGLGSTFYFEFKVEHGS